MLRPVFSKRPSAVIAAIGYDYPARLLTVQFTGGAVYTYTGVPKPVVNAFRRSTSKGRFFAFNIRGLYSFTKAGEAV